MTTLHIEHPITDLAEWRRAFDTFADARRRAGVVSHVVRQPVDDPHHLSVDLEFPDLVSAEGFRTFLRTSVWASAEASPALRGTPVATIPTSSRRPDRPHGGALGGCFPPGESRGDGVGEASPTARRASFPGCRGVLPKGTK